MTLKSSILAITILAASAAAQTGPRDPFPLGSVMAPQGAIVDPEGVSGRDPWASAAFYRDTLRWGASAAAVSYHGGGSASKFAAGGFGTIGPATVKGAFAQLDAMGIYYEQTAAVSAGAAWRSLSFGADARLHRLGLYGSGGDSRASAALGAAVMLKTRRISADLTARDLTVLTSGDPAADPPPTFTARVCAVENRYGSQGAILKITPGEEYPVRFIIAQEYRIGKTVAITASIASNPTMIGFGLTVDKSPATASAAVVNHPFLGWSKGVAVDYAR